MKLNTLTVRGYKSIRALEDLELRNLNLLIGANGAGKSNLISLFRLYTEGRQGRLQRFVQMQGGPDVLLFGGRKRTAQIEFLFGFEEFVYRVVFLPTTDNQLVLEESNFVRELYSPEMHSMKSPTKLTNSDLTGKLVLWNCRVYHFQDTSGTAAVKQIHPSNDNLLLKPDAANLAAYIARIKGEAPEAYQRIVSTIRLAAPFFGDFVVRDPLPQTVELEWTERGDPDTPYRAHVLSDGTLRFLCLTTLLLQPDHLLPDTILIDEPELGLHPYAINLLAEMLKQVAATKQVIVSTQSVELLDNFQTEDVIVVDRCDGASTFRRLEQQELADWLEDYSMGELWKRNILGGRPTFESADV